LWAVNVDGTSLRWRPLQVSEQTYYRWRNQFGWLKTDDAKRLKDLERENATLRRLLAAAELEKDELKEIARGKLLSPERRRAAVRHLMTSMGLSERFACRVTGQTELRSDTSQQTRRRLIPTLRWLVAA
jgi:Transposase